MRFDGRQPLTDNDLKQKTNIDGILPKKMFTTPHFDSHSTTDPKPEILSAVLTGNIILCDGRNVRGIMHVHMCRNARMLQMSF